MEKHISTNEILLLMFKRYNNDPLNETIRFKYSEIEQNGNTICQY